MGGRLPEKLVAKKIAPFRRSTEKCVLLAEIARRWFAAGTFSVAGQWAATDLGQGR
jgi:hypothetical protein